MGVGPRDRARVGVRPSDRACVGLRVRIVSRGSTEWRTREHIDVDSSRGLTRSGYRSGY